MDELDLNKFAEEYPEAFAKIAEEIIGAFLEEVKAAEGEETEEPEEELSEEGQEMVAAAEAYGKEAAESFLNTLIENEEKQAGKWKPISAAGDVIKSLVKPKEYLAHAEKSVDKKKALEILQKSLKRRRIGAGIAGGVGVAGLGAALTRKRK